MSVTPTPLERLQAAFRESAIEVMSQMQAQPWSASIDASADLSTAHPFSIELRGREAVRFDLFLSIEAIHAINEIFGGAPATLATDSAGAALTTEQREVVDEFLRQVLGLATSRLKPDFGELNPAVLSAQEVLSAADAQVTSLSNGSRTIVYSLSISEVESQSLGKLLKLPESLQQEATPPAPAPPADSAIAECLQERNFNLLLDVELAVTLRFGRREMLLKDILELDSGSVVELDRLVQEPVELLLDRKLIARGEVVIVEGNYGVRVTEVASPEQRIECLY